MVSFKNVLLFATVAFSTILIRDVNTILANLAKIDADFKKLTTDTKAWDGTATGSIPILQDQNAINTDTRAATSELANEAQLSSTNSNRVVNYVVGTLTPDIKAALTAILSRRTDFNKIGFNGIVKQELQTDKTDLDAYFTALIKLLSADTKVKGSNAQSTIDVNFNSVIAAFT